MKHGVMFSLLSSLLFALLCYYSIWLQPLDGMDIFAWRILMSLPFFIVILLLRREVSAFFRHVQALLQRPHHVGITLLCTLLIGVQIGIFGWAPVHQQSRELAMGYFILPLAMVVVGWAGFGETLTGWQRLAVLCATCGVAVAMLSGGGLSLVSLIVVLGYPPYFVLKRRLQQEPFHGVLLETLLLTPPALWLIVDSPHHLVGSPLSTAMMLAALGTISGTALLFYLLASRKLPLSMFGMLSYVEPLLLFGVSLLLSAPLPSALEIASYLPIWLAIILLIVDSMQKQRRQRHVSKCQP